MAGGADGRAGYRTVLAIPDFRRLTIGLVVDSAGSWAYGVVLLVYVFDRTHSPTWVAVTTVTRFLPGLLFSSYAGVVAERFERTTVLIASALGCFLTMTAMAVLVALGGPVGLLVGLSVLSATIGTPFTPAVGALVPQIVDERNLAAANAVNSTIENVSTILGPALGGLLLLTGEPAAAFTLNALTFLFSASCLARVRTRSVPTDVTEHGSSPVAQVLVGFRALRQTPAAAAPVAVSVIATFVYGADTVLFVPVSRHLHGGHGGYGYLLTALALGGVAAAALVNTLASRFRLSWSIGLGMLAYCLPMALIPMLHAMPGGLALQVLRGLGTVVVDVLALTALQRAVPTHLLSRVLGVFETLVFGACAGGALVVAPLLHVLGLRGTLLLFAFAAPALALFALPALLSIDRQARQRLKQLEPTLELLAGLEPFTAATRAALEQLAAAAQPVAVTAGEVVVREGGPADAFYVVEDGDLEVVSRGEFGRPRIVAGLGSGSFFGEIGLLHGVARTATVRATCDSHLLRIDADDFRQAMETGAVNTAMLTTAGLRLSQTHPALARRTAPDALVVAS